jgi:hypothetical protein
MCEERPSMEQADAEGPRRRSIQCGDKRRFQRNNDDNATRDEVSDGRTGIGAISVASVDRSSRLAFTIEVMRGRH